MRKFALLFCLFLTACSGSSDKDAPETVGSVDLSRFQGRWYEIARYPNVFEDTAEYRCVGVTAEYALRPDGKVTVTNSCYKNTLAGELDVATGIARVVGGNGSKLKVKFAPQWVPFASGDYWVFDLTEDYSAALVGSPDGKFLWILSRRPMITQENGRRMMESVKAKGFETQQLQFTLQPIER